MGGLSWVGWVGWVVWVGLGELGLVWWVELEGLSWVG